jgi:hypothetical protein
LLTPQAHEGSGIQVALSLAIPDEELEEDELLEEDVELLDDVLEVDALELEEELEEELDESGFEPAPQPVMSARTTRAQPWDFSRMLIYRFSGILPDPSR